MLRHIPVDRIDQISPPPRVFNILVIGHGYSAAEIGDQAKQAWKEIARIAFGGVGRAYSQRLSVLYDDAPLNLGFTATTAGALAIPATKRTALSDRIATLAFKDHHGTQWAGSKVWPQGNVAGIAGGLVLVLVKPTASIPAGELYRITSSSDYPTPLAAVVVGGTQFWGNLLARAVAQKLVGLYDEYSLPGDDFKTPPTD